MSLRGPPVRPSGHTLLPDASTSFLLLWPFLLSAPLLITGEPTRLLFILLAAPLVLCLVLKNLPRPRSAVGGHPVLFCGLALFAAMSATAALRGNLTMMDADARMGLAATICLFFGMSVFSFRPASLQTRRISALSYALPTYVAFNLALYLFTDPPSPGPDPRFPQVNEMLGLVGVEVERVTRFGLIRGANALGLMAGISIVLTGCRLSRRERPNLVAAALLIANIAALLLAESRAALVVSLLCLILFHCLRRGALMTVARAALLFWALSPWLLVPLYQALGPALIRQQGEALGVGTGRPRMLEAGTKFLSSFDVQHIWGYGHYGHLTSEASRPFEWMFQADLARSSFHNAALQQAIDIGYAGAALYFALMWQAAGLLARTPEIPRALAKSLVATLLFVIVMGTTEVIGAAYHLEIFGLILGLFGIAAAQPARNAFNGSRSNTSNLPPSLALTTRPPEAA